MLRNSAMPGSLTPRHKGTVYWRYLFYLSLRYIVRLLFPLQPFVPRAVSRCGKPTCQSPVPPRPVPWHARPCAPHCRAPMHPIPHACQLPLPSILSGEPRPTANPWACLCYRNGLSLPPPSPSCLALRDPPPRDRNPRPTAPSPHPPSPFRSQTNNHYFQYA